MQLIQGEDIQISAPFIPDNYISNKLRLKDCLPASDNVWNDSLLACTVFCNYQVMHNTVFLHIIFLL